MSPRDDVPAGACGRVRRVPLGRVVLVVLVVFVVLVIGVALGVLGDRLIQPGAAAPEVAALPWGVVEPGPAWVVARVGDEVVTAEELNARWTRLLEEDARRFHEARGGKAHFAGEVAEEVLLAQEAERRGLRLRPAIAAAVRAAANRALAAPLLAAEVRGRVVAEADVAAYFEAHRDEWTDPPRVELSEIVATAAPGPAGIAAGDDARTADEARAKVEALRARSLAGESFADLARRHSEAPSAAHGGRLGWRTAAELAPAYAEPALALAAGETSPVLNVAEGSVVLHATARDGGGPRELAEVRDVIVGRFLAEDPGALRRRYRAFVDELAAKTRYELLPLPANGADSTPSPPPLPPQ